MWAGLPQSKFTHKNIYFSEISDGGRPARTNGPRKPNKKKFFKCKQNMLFFSHMIQFSN